MTICKVCGRAVRRARIRSRGKVDSIGPYVHIDKDNWLTFRHVAVVEDQDAD